MGHFRICQGECSWFPLGSVQLDTLMPFGLGPLSHWKDESQTLSSSSSEGLWKLIFVSDFKPSCDKISGYPLICVPVLNMDAPSSLLVCVPVPLRAWCCCCCCLVAQSCLFVIPRTAACQAPLPMGFPRQEYWSGLPFPSPGNLPDQGIKPTSSALANGLFTNWATREAHW